MGEKNGRGDAREARWAEELPRPPPRRRFADGTTPPPMGDDSGREEERYLGALGLLQRSQWGEAREVLLGLAVCNPVERKYRVLLHYAWACEHEADGRVEEACAELRRSLTLDPHFEPSARSMEKLRRSGGVLRRWFGLAR